MIKQYEQLILEYEHFLWMAKQLPGLPRHALSYTPWRYSSSTDVYGTSGGWTQAINTGAGVIPGYRRAPYAGWLARSGPSAPPSRTSPLIRSSASRRTTPPSS
jgi:hypothetical protein